VEPYFTDAAALLATSGEKGEGNGIYAALADTLIRFGAEELDRNAPPVEIERSEQGWFDLHADALVARLGALDQAESRWRSAAELISRQEILDPNRQHLLASKRLSLAVRAAEANQRGATLLVEAPPPPGLSEEEAAAYRTLLKEKAIRYESRADEWMEEIERATKDGIGPSLSQRYDPGAGRDDRGSGR